MRNKLRCQISGHKFYFAERKPAGDIVYIPIRICDRCGFEESLALTNKSGNEK